MEDGYSVSGSGSVPPPFAKSGRGLKSGRNRHLRSKGAAPSSPAQLAAAARGPRKPLDGEEPAAFLRVRVVKANDLVAKDRNGTSDPYVRSNSARVQLIGSFISLLLPPSTRHQTPVMKKSLNPSFPSDGSTFDYPIYLSLAGVVGARGLEGVVWDKVGALATEMSELTTRICYGKSTWEK
jgi:phosphatidylserine decarboxylase